MAILRRKLISKKIVKGKKRPVYKFSWDIDGKPAKKRHIEYAKKLGIPPDIDQNSVEVYWPKTPKQLASWKDKKGRKQTIYHPSFTADREIKKYKRYEKLNKDYNNIIKKIEKLFNSNKEKDKQSAIILYLIAKTGFRVGSNRDTLADKKAYGISTLLNKHIKIIGNKIILDFPGKKGVRNKKTIIDKKLSDTLKNYKTSNYSKRLFNVSDTYIRNVLDNISNYEYNIKDFRTLKANEIAKKEINKKKGPAINEKQFNKWQREVADKVAKELGNTRSIALNKYIDPKIWIKWRSPEWKIWMPKLKEI